MTSYVIVFASLIGWAHAQDSYLVDNDIGKNCNNNDSHQSTTYCHNFLGYNIIRVATNFAILILKLRTVKLLHHNKCLKFPIGKKL